MVRTLIFARTALQPEPFFGARSTAGSPNKGDTYMLHCARDSRAQSLATRPESLQAFRVEEHPRPAEAAKAHHGPIFILSVYSALPRRRGRGARKRLGDLVAALAPEVTFRAREGPVLALGVCA